MDWCAAAERVALPATGDTVVLQDNPASAAAWARRVAAINHEHREADQPIPGEGSSVTALLRIAAGRPAVPQQNHLTVSAIEPLLRETPASGWPAGLFGRRDRLLLLLTAAVLRAASYSNYEPLT